MARPLDPHKSSAIIAAARRVFGRRGFHATGVADIAGELGIGHGTVYRYFKNKLQVFDAVVATAIESMLGVLVDEAPDAAEDLDAYRAQVRRIGRRLAGHLRAHPDVAHLLFVEAVGIDPGISKRLDGARRHLTDFTARYVSNGVNKGFSREGLDTEMSARILNACILEAARDLMPLAAAIDDGSKSAADFDAALERWLDAVDELVFLGMASERSRGAARIGAGPDEVEPAPPRAVSKR